MSKPLLSKAERPAPLRRLAAMLLVLLALAMAFAAGLSLSRLETLQSRAVLSQADAAGAALRQALEAAVRFGKPLQSGVGLVGMEERIKTARQSLPALAGLSIADAEGAIVQSLDQTLEGQSLGAVLGPDWDANATAVSHAGMRQLLLPVRNPDGSLAGRLVLGIPEAVFTERIHAGMRSALTHMLYCLAGAGVLLAVALPLAARSRTGDPNRRIMLAGCLSTGLALLCYSVLTIHDFRQLHRQVLQDKSLALAGAAAQDINRLLDKGLPLERMLGLDRRLGALIDGDAEIESMAVLDTAGQVRYLATAAGNATAADDSPADPSLQFDTALERAVQGQSEPAGLVRVRLSHANLAEATRQIVLDTATVGIIALLFLVETILLALRNGGHAARRTRPSESSVPTSPAPVSVGYGAIRPVAFLFLFALDTSLSFIPLQMEVLYTPIFGLAKDVVLGLPISAEMGCAGLTVLASGAWIDRIGWRLPCMLGLAGAAAGSLLSALAPDALTFIAARGITGLGYGLGIMATQGFVVAATRPDERGRGMAQLFAGVYAGSLCGGAAGAMLAERVGYAPIFLIAAALLLALALALPLLFRDATPAAGIAHAAGHPGTPVAPVTRTPGALPRFLRSRAVLALACCAILPGALGLIGYLNYLLPLALVRGGASQSDVGRVLMLYSVCLIYLAPPLARIIDQSSRRHVWITAAGILAAMGLGAYAVLDGMAAAAAATAMLGLSASIAFAAQSAFALDLAETRALGEATALSITSAIERLGQVLGPLCLGMAVAVLGLGDGVALVGLGVLAATLLFWLLTRHLGRTQ
ncbi:MFS transporter [Megalodesulfovibrio gigas]|uniref:Major facilitator superfamily (MFS) profile domain-containing protein n=1 Tax=Megalodesulfovibrio gigas (strain ATCC 19364 / DSM 1382 / NCIMB 9332 / VKM B-1759) TaxID=1121448 RepID=T2GEV3_MEGG1|nr:MFS transporter [Megalodesulfovibrio gigas]AGW14641.1 hypothetical protein DGI_2915 [Megalodesulfovibrio gigas DSM 1382 = ATCC 19364]